MKRQAFIVKTTKGAYQPRKGNRPEGKELQEKPNNDIVNKQNNADR